MKHSPEPWPEPDEHPDVDGVYMVPERDYARACACVNACAGINPDAVPALVKACEAARELYDHMALGSLEAAAKYGPDYEPPTDEDCLAVRAQLEAALDAAKVTP